MYKNIFIMGPGRAGKTTLSKMLNKKYGYSIISIDDIVSGFEAYPKLQIHHDGDENDTAKRLVPFLLKY
jgi:adenylate kinase family enzyme